MDNLPKVRIAKLSSVQPDPKNANQHTERGRNMVERSLRERGFFRPMAAAGKGAQPVMIAGNLTQEVATDIGMDEAIIIETDGTRPLVHIRTDVEPGSEQAVLLGLEDNRAAEVSLNLDRTIMLDFKAKFDLKPLWSDEEFKMKFELPAPEQVTPPDDFSSYDESLETAYQCPKCHYAWSGKPK